MLNKNNYYYPNIKLLGNSRYRYSSPLLFVEDQKIIADKSFGLIPIPLEKYKRKEIMMKMKKIYMNYKGQLLWQEDINIIRKI